MKCRNCGFENTEEAKFCINCGKRIDGKILCPKCQTYIVPDSLNCPNCGQKIPHREPKEELPKEVSERKNNIYRGFKKGFNIASLILFVVAIFAIVFNYIPELIGGLLNKDMMSVAGPTILTWLDIPVLSSYASQSEIATMLTTSIVFALSFIAIIAITLIFSIKGLVSSINGLKTKNYKVNVMNLAVIYLTFVIGQAFLRGTSFTYYLNGTSVEFSTYGNINNAFLIIYCIFAVVLFGSMFVIEMIFRTNKHYIVDRILFICMFIFMLILLGVFQDEYMSFRTESSQYFGGNVIAYFFSILFNVTNVTFTSQNIVLFILSVFNLVFFLLEISVLGFGFVYFLVRAFSTANKLRSYRVPTYASVFCGMILSSLMLSIGIAAYIINKSLVSYCSFGDFVFTNFILMTILTGISIASLAIYRSNVRREKLMKLTSVEKKWK